MSTSERSYHHGDLRSALLQAATACLESGEPFSLRGVARRAGVSAAAPYRHFADRTALESALAIDGFRSLGAELAAAVPPASAPPADAIADLAIAYVGFALRHPEVFHLMFGRPCDPADVERVTAVDALHAVLGELIARYFPDADAPALAVALWSVAHGLAFLHLDGKLTNDSDVAPRVRAATTSLLSLATTVKEKP